MLPYYNLSINEEIELAMKSVPVYEAKNHLSELIAAVELGEEVSITRRGLPVARLVIDPASASAEEQRERVTHALDRLRTLRAKILLKGDLKAIAREGLD